jgi:hypothetical protein
MSELMLRERVATVGQGTDLVKVDVRGIDLVNNSKFTYFAIELSFLNYIRLLKYVVSFK